jgi:hypothetical protein
MMKKLGRRRRNKDLIGGNWNGINCWLNLMIKKIKGYKIMMMMRTRS